MALAEPLVRTWRCRRTGRDLIALDDLLDAGRWAGVDVDDETAIVALLAAGADVEMGEGRARRASAGGLAQCCVALSVRKPSASVKRFSDTLTGLTM